MAAKWRQKVGRCAQRFPGTAALWGMAIMLLLAVLVERFVFVPMFGKGSIMGWQQTMLATAACAFIGGLAGLLAQLYLEHRRNRH